MPDPDLPVPRRILGFSQDEAGDWVAALDCGHRRHVRHRPPRSTYPWVLDAQGRASRVGQSIECLRCGRFELPEGLSVYKSTPVFDAASVPAGLLADHRGNDRREAPRRRSFSARALLWAEARLGHRLS